jgi:lysophospholipase L1-like esterase
MEGAARLLPQREEDRYAGDFVEPDPDLYWRLRRVGGGPVQTNALGFRDDAYDPDADVAILLVGDSVSWGDSVGDTSAVYPQLLERILAAERPGTSFEVINASVPGYSTGQERRYLERRGLALAPEIVVVQFSLNDVVGPYTELAERGGTRTFMGVDTRQATRGLFGALLRRSRAFEIAVRGLQRLARDQEAYAVRNLAREALPPELLDAWNETIEELDLIAAMLRSRAIPWLLMIVPYRFQLADAAGLRQPQDFLLSRLGNDVRRLDLLPYLAAVQHRRAAPLFLDPSHLSIEGHRVVAQVLAASLLDLVDAAIERGP